MVSMQFVLQPLPGTDDQFIERIREVSEKVNRFGYGTHRIFEQLKIPVREVVIGPTHIGVLLEDGKAFRVSFSINSEKLDLTKSDAKCSTSGGGGTASASKAPSSSRPMARSRARLLRATGRSSSTGQGSGSRSTGVIIGGSTSSRPLVTVPATYVPEELISQAEVVLQGKSRNLIIRELQRTNLDVNLAVNNLLSRDDEEAEDTEEGADNYVPEDLISLLDNGFSGDNNSVIIDPSDGLFSEEIFSNYSSIRNLLFDRIRSERSNANANAADSNQSTRSTTSGAALTGSSGLSAQISVNADREAFSRWRDRQYYGPRRWISKDDYTWEKDADSKKKEPSPMLSPIWISEELQPWPEKSSVRFKTIGALYSEFIALSEGGDLYQWRWADAEPYKSETENVYHPKTAALNITERVELISANFIRCSVVTETNRVATWMDEQLGYLGAKLEHNSCSFNEFISDNITKIYVCSLYTVVKTDSNNIYWWGVLPFDQRRYLWDKFRTKTKKPFKVVATDINVGAQVIMKKCPIYQSGSIGFTCSNGVPKVGQLLNSVWNFTDVCRMKIININTNSGVDKTQAAGLNLNAHGVAPDKDLPKATAIPSSGSSKNGQSFSNSKESTDRIDMPPPPSPASSTCSDTGSVTSHKRTKRVTTKEDSNAPQEGRKDEELWQLKDVVFVEDKVGPVGKVLKVDGDFVAVRFPAMNAAAAAVAAAAATASSSSNTASTSKEEGKEDDWQQCRLLRREDVQIFRTAMSTRGPDWLQKQPKKINVGADAAGVQLLTLAVDSRGIHVIKKVLGKIHYSLYNLYNSKQEQNCLFPTDCASFIGSSPGNILMACNNDCSGNSSTIVLRDGNGALYPLAKDCLGSIKDPQWFDLPPVKSITMSTISLPAMLSGVNLKSKVCMTALLFDTQKLMPHILRCDVKNSFAALSRLEREDQADTALVVEERCDGARNIFHACVIMCAPSSNKDSPPDSPSGGVEKKSLAVGLSVARSIPTVSTSAYVSSNAFGANASSSNENSSFATMSSSAAGSSSSTSRDSRMNLRDMMHRLINSDQAEQSGSQPMATNNEDHAYIPWPAEAPAASNLSASSSQNIADSIEDDISKIIPSSSQSSLLSNIKLGSPNYTFDLAQRREHALLILQQMCVSPALRPYLCQMLSTKDAQGQTPFMLSVSCRAYEAGIILLNTILLLSEQDPPLKEAMIFPTGSPADQSPLHVICYNDTCSFTWTGADHINQNIFECKTCGLTGSLCCCTECARVCHKGHDCKLKRTAPTAYCDCWEKCKCKALIAGNLTKRFALLCKLVSCTDLVTKFNSKGESILLFLIQTVGRQIVEQRQYRFNVRVRSVGTAASGTNGSNTVISNRKASSVDMDSDMPDHDLEPPKFARKALERLLIDWNAVRSMVMSGAEKTEVPNPSSGSENSNSEGFNMFIQTQHGSTLLDKFTHSLIVKCTGDHLDTLLLTLVRELQNVSVANRCKEAEEVARRFVRSVARVFVIFNLEKQPNPEKRKTHTSCNKYVQSCVKVFQTLHKISIEELCEVSEALIAPVRLGVVRPTAPFTMSSSNLDNSDDLFSVDPLAPSNVESSSEQILGHDSGNDQSPSFNIQQNYDVVAMETIRDASESEEVINREANSHNQDDELIENQRNEDGMQDDESDNDFTFNDAETESDSDDNQSNQEVQRSVQTGATVGSENDIGVLFLEDESGDSSAQEEDGSEDGESDDHSDEFNFNDQQLERRSTNSNARSDLAPQTMQWAIRNRDTARSSVRVPTGSNLVFIDPMALRRSTVPASTTVTTPSIEPHTMATTASNLARAFGITIRQISELISILSYNIVNDIETSLKIQSDEAIAVQAFVEKRLKATWDWMFTVMDGTEAQLKFGAYLTNYTDPNHPLHPLNLSAQASTSQTPAPATSSSVSGVNVMGSNSRRDFFTYCLSLMRAHTSEHRDALPVLDITALRHIAYVLDAFVYYMRNDTGFYDKQDTISGRINNLSPMVESYDTDDELTNLEDFNADVQPSTSSMPSGSQGTRRHAFFARSESTLSLGCSAPEGFDLPLDMAMPLADKPHLLQPNSKRQELFANLPLLVTTSASNSAPSNSGGSIFDYTPTRLGFSNSLKRNEHVYETDPAKQSMEVVINMDTSKTGDGNVTYKAEGSTDSNIYVQLKKKQGSDDFKSHKEADGNHSKYDKVVLMETDDISSLPSTSKSTEALMATRPEVIIAPNKASVSPATAARSVIVLAGGSCLKTIDSDLNNFSASNVSTAEQAKCDTHHQKSTPHHQLSFPVRGSLFYQSNFSELPSWNFLLSRWKLTLDLFGRVFMDDVGMEHGSVLPELRGFPVKEMRFRRHMEKLRNGQQRDLVLCKLERNRESLIVQTFKELNTQFGNQNRRTQPPITFNRVKVTFKDEPGEGSGVARSFYTSIAEALLASAKIPNLESVQVGTSHSKYGVPFSSILRSRTVSGSSRDQSTLQRRGTSSKILWRSARERKALNLDARPYTPVTNSDNAMPESLNDHLSVHLQQIGERLYPKIHSINQTHAPKITGMLLEIPTPQLLSVISSDETLRQKVNEAIEIITFKLNSEASAQSSQPKKSPSVVLVEPVDDDNEPLFYSPGKRGFYTPRQGFASFERINAFRNIGRLIGLCLLQNELLPLFLQRHVLKYILGRKIKFHDLAFFDPALYESFRQIIQNAQTKEGEETINRMELCFVIDLMKEEGCGNRELIPGGREVAVTSGNIFEYIRRYTEYRLIKSQEKALEALKDGVFDVLPDNSMNSLTAEDLRLLLNGVGDINVSTLISYTTFNDESSEGPDKLLKFKKWFWSIVEKMNILERQDLVYFWTGSPALPASEEGFQPLPSVTIRPADDSHLPTANTCISRLYIPLYSSKSILRSKMLMAIKSKNFGFV
ncbi:E3 ubiquitin-protein ligase hyd [Drosophila suzukii]|uniref:E3 ubiquitin-protein ligase hyd n=1 Tax=Drosophila suzukii TaxID=28584 RepID=A0AB39ZD17_DROSZ